jgi:hypothetical protein
MIDIDISTISDAGINSNLSRLQDSPEFFIPRYTSARNISGGTLGENGVIFIGSRYVKIDGKNKCITVNDGTNDRILIGFQEAGF